MHGQEVYVGDQLVLMPATGVIRFMHRKKVLLDQAGAGVLYTAAGDLRKRADLAGRPISYGLSRDGVTVSAANDELELTWLLTAGEELHLRLEVRNVGSRPVRIEELCVLDVTAERGGALGLGPRARNWRFFQNGWQSWTPAFARDVTDGLWVNPNTADYRTKHEPHASPGGGDVLSSEWFTVITPRPREDPSRTPSPAPALLVGFVTAADQLGEIRLAVRDSFHSLCAVSHADGYPLSPGEKLSSETLVVATGEDPLALLELYALRLGKAMHARVADKVPSGWCTWYYFYGEETSDDVAANLKTIQQEDVPLETILIDDGYEMAIGDWLDVDRAKYPQGMKAIAEQIAASGHRPGIWTAPLGAGANSKLYAAHSDWVLRDHKGEPVLAWQHWGVDVYALDASLPAVQAWLGETFRVLAEDWGFQMFKIDFLFAGALAGVRADPRLTRGGALRRGLEAIRHAIGERFLLGCGAPLGPAVGVVDAMRIGTDVSINWRPFWQDLSEPATCNAMLNSMTRGFMHRKLWLNDPDCLLLRPRGSDSNLSLNEARMWTTVAGMTGGLVWDSDNLPSMPRARLEYLQRVLPPYGQSGVPVDLFRNERPQRLVLPVRSAWGTWTLVALLNWDDQPRTTQVSLSALGLPSRSHHLYDYWRRLYGGIVRDEISVHPHHAHEAVLFLLKPVSEKPQLLTSTFHLTQGAMEVKSVQLLPDRLVVEMEKAGKQHGQLLFAIPAEFTAVQALVDGKPRKLRHVSTGIWEVSFTLNGRARVELLFG